MNKITPKDMKCQNASKCLLRKGTESKDTSSHTLLDHSNAFGLSRTKLKVHIQTASQIFQTCPFWAPVDITITLDQT